MSLPSVLIVTSGPACRNPRPLKEAITLDAAGYGVTLLTVFETERAAADDRELLADTNIRMHVVREPAGGGQGLRRKLRRWLARRAVAYLGYQSHAVLGPTTALYEQALRCDSALTIVHNEAPFWAGCRLLERGRRIAADFEDWYSEDLLPAARRHRPLRLLRVLEKRLLANGAYTTTTSHALARALGERYREREPAVLSNSFSTTVPVSRRGADEVPKLLWFSQTVGPGRGIEEFLAAWQSARQPSTLSLLGACPEAYREHLLSQVPPARRASLQFHAPVSPRELPGVIARHDIGLALEQKSPPSRNLTITNKILQYLVAGVMVVATDTDGQREVLAEFPQAGALVDLARREATTRQLDELFSNPFRIGELKAGARAAAEAHYCWERQERVLLDLVAAALRP